MKKFYSLLIACFFMQTIYSQIPDGSVAPDFTLTSISGTTYNLYDIIDAGQVVAIDYSATWCGICWNYHQTHTFENAFQMYGPAGSNQLMSFFIETEPLTNESCLYGPDGCNYSTLGNWVENTTHPFFNLTTPEDFEVKSNYGITGVPTIGIISPDKRWFEIGSTSNLAVWDSWINESFALEAEANITMADCAGTSGGSIDLSATGGAGFLDYLWSNGATTQNLVDIGEGTYSVTITDNNDYFIVLEDLEVLGTTGNLDMTAPPSENLTCSISEYPAYETLAAYETGGGIVESECALVEDSFGSQTTSDGNTCPETFTRNYFIMDESGDMISVSQNIEVYDLLAPTFLCPGNITVNDITEAPAYGSLSEFMDAAGEASDNCNLDDASFSIINEEEDGMVYTRLYQIEDMCGNVSNCTQTVTVVQLQEGLNCPGTLSVPLETDAPPYANFQEFLAAGGSFEGENLDTMTFQLSSQVSDGGFCPETLTRTYLILDTDGVEYTCTQDIEVTGEAISLMVDYEINGLEISCTSETSGFIFGTEWDFGDGTLSDEQNPSHIYAEPGVYEVCCFVANLCDFENVCFIAYMGVNPANLKDITTEIECLEDVPAPLASLEAYLDAGGESEGELDSESFTFIEETIDTLSLDVGCLYLVEQKYTVTDTFGTLDNASIFIEVRDTVGPVLTNVSAGALCSHDEVSYFESLLEYTDFGGTVLDNCMGEISGFEFVSESSDGNICPEIFTRVYQVTDQCGNTANFEQIISINDTENPTISIADITVATNADVPLIPADLNDFIFSGGVVSDNCEIDANSYQVNEESDGNVMPEIITRTYSITDLCGNLSVFSQKITVNMPVSSQETAWLTSFQMTPNPAKDVVNLNVEMPSSGEINISIFTIAGKQIWQDNSYGSNWNNNISIGTWNSGLYLVQIKTKQGLLTKKLVVE